MARPVEFKYMKESTYHAHYQKYLQEHAKLSSKHEFKGNRVYQFNDFVRNFNDACEIEMLEGKTPDKYNLYKKLAKSDKAFTDKQEKAFRKSWNENLKMLSNTEKAILRSGQAFTSQGLISSQYAALHMSELVAMFDSYGTDWRAHIDS